MTERTEDQGGAHTHTGITSPSSPSCPDELTAAPPVSPASQEETDRLAALETASLLRAPGLEEDLDWAEVWFSAQQGGVDGVDQQRPGTSGGFLAS